MPSPSSAHIMPAHTTWMLLSPAGRESGSTCCATVNVRAPTTAVPVGTASPRPGEAWCSLLPADHVLAAPATVPTDGRPGAPHHSFREPEARRIETAAREPSTGAWASGRSTTARDQPVVPPVLGWMQHEAQLRAPAIARLAGLSREALAAWARGDWQPVAADVPLLPALLELHVRLLVRHPNRAARRRWWCDARRELGWLSPAELLRRGKIGEVLLLSPEGAEDTTPNGTRARGGSASGGSARR